MDMSQAQMVHVIERKQRNKYHLERVLIKERTTIVNKSYGINY